MDCEKDIFNNFMLITNNVKFCEVVQCKTIGKLYNFGGTRIEMNLSGASIDDQFNKGTLWLVYFISCEREIALC